jgi:hypothetical protein
MTCFSDSTTNKNSVNFCVEYLVFTPSTVTAKKQTWPWPWPWPSNSLTYNKPV